jgi:serine/threonine protein phosphatase PrpC
LKLEAVTVTDVGVVRDHNEDSAHVDPGQRFFIVADGMGGHAAGEVASAMAVDSVRRSLEAAGSLIDAFTQRPNDTSRRALVQLLQSAVLSAHQAVFQRGSRESDKAGMGTTLDVLLVAGREAFVAHVGDSRTYLIRDGKASQLTTDHTVAEVLVIEGKLTIEEALVSPYRTVLVNAIGVAADVGVEMAHLQLRESDRLLVCSDGLHDYYLAEQEIADVVGTGDPLAKLTTMVQTAKDRGGHDNITGVLVHVVELREGVPAAIDGDETAPVPGADGSSAFGEDDRTENISPRDLERIGGEPRRAGRPALVVTPPGSDARGADATDPGLDLRARGHDDDTPQVPGPAVPVGIDDRTVPAGKAHGGSQRRAIERAETSPPPHDEGDGVPRADDDDAIPDALALGDTGPVPRVELDDRSGPHR